MSCINKIAYADPNSYLREHIFDLLKQLANLSIQLEALKIAALSSEHIINIQQNVEQLNIYVLLRRNIIIMLNEYARINDQLNKCLININEKIVGQYKSITDAFPTINEDVRTAHALLIKALTLEKHDACKNKQTNDEK